MKLSWISILFFTLAACSNINPIQPPASKYRTSTEQENVRLAKAGRLHDAEKYHEAIALYRSILENNPANTVALYELALSHFSLNEFEQSLQYAKAAAEYDSPFLPSVYLLIGLDYKKLNQPEQALSVYQFATRRFDRHIELHYQLAAMYLALNDPGHAADVFKKIITLDPRHRDSHLQLGMAYYLHDYKTPAMLSLLTFLLLEPDSHRSEFAVSLLDDIFKSGVIIDSKTKQVTLAINPDAKTDEGDFGFTDALLSTRRVDLLTSGKKYSEVSLKREQLKSFLMAVSQLKTETDRRYFIKWHAFPFYSSLHEAGLSDALFYYTHQSLKQTEISRWLAGNRKQVEKLEAFVRNYKWK